GLVFYIDVKRLIGLRFDDPVVQSDMKRWPFRVVSEEGRPKIQVSFQGSEKTYFAEEISSMVLRKMKETAEAFLGGKTVRDAVITVPAYFKDAQREATKEAGAMAGLNVIRIINEPTAAALAYGFDRKVNGRTVLIYDLGGGTLDVTVMTIKNGDFDVKSTCGNTHLGGQDFTQLLVDHFIKENSYEEYAAENKLLRRRLNQMCNIAKEKISFKPKATIELTNFPAKGMEFETTLTRECFEKLAGSLFRSTMEYVRQGLKDANMDKSSIDEVILVGGSTRIPKIRKLLSDFFGNEKIKEAINPDEAVAYGAALQAANLNGDLKGDINLHDVTPFSLGIAIRENFRDMSFVVKKNSRIPLKKNDVFFTMYDNQERVSFRVYEGESAVTKDNDLLGQFELTDVPPKPAGEAAFDVTFDIDENGILEVTAVSRDTGRSNNIIVKKPALAQKQRFP
ncbi:unnamed protein product, partial [Cyprideis torosa]